MSRNASIVRAVVDAVNRHDPADDLEHLADDLVFCTPAIGETDKAGWRAFHDSLYAAFPDFAVSADRLIVDGDVVAIEARVTGTHRADFARVPATNRAIELPIVFVVDLADGKARRWRSYYDSATMLRQLGVRE